MADASTWQINIMDNWEWNAADWTSFGLVALAQTALLVPVWEYLALALVLTTIWLYRVLDFHFVSDLLHGFRGEVPRLHHSLTSKLKTDILPKCEILRQRFFATPWLSSPHLQTAFLHFNGNPPPVKYHRQLFITPDKGTIALDWVKQPLRDDTDTNAENREFDETPIVIIIPGLTSSSEDPYLKHIAYESGKMGWRTLVCNHRGLGGVSITSDQFYNAGWTVDLRTIVNYIHGKYPEAPLFVIGTSVGANIVVKYLGEEGDATPVGAAAAVCNPWDLVVADRFINRKGVQKLYSKALAYGLMQYAQLHRTVMDRIADGGFISKSKTLREFDHHCTRHVGKFETVDTYYRRSSSADFLMKVAVPLLCFNSTDDPVCSAEAIPWDEIVANPNVVMVNTKHGGHLAFFEGFTARTIWWTRALIEYMAIIIPSDLMYTPQKVPMHTRTSELDVDKSPYLHVSSDGLVAAEDLELSNSEITGQEDNSNEDDVIFAGEGRLAKTFPDQDVSYLKDLDDEDGYVDQASVTLTFKDNTELSSLQSALSQLLQQLRDLPSTAQQCSLDNGVSNEDNAGGNSKNRTVRALKDCTVQAIEVPVSSAVTSALKNCREVATKLTVSSMRNRGMILEDTNLGTGSPPAITDKISAQAGGKHEANSSNLTGYTWLASQNRRSFWLLTYVALVTTCPWIGSLFFFWWRQKTFRTSIGLTK